MTSDGSFFKSQLSSISAKTVSLGAKQYFRSRNEQKIKFQEEYRYAPLSGPRSIRLVRIHHGADTDVVTCDVFEVSLDNQPVFEALSYTWDLDPEWSWTKLEIVEDKKKEERPILCNGKTMHISMNLYHALTEFRRRRWTLPIWADQICINQNDREEKISQIAIMVDIYRSAACVNVWLGKVTNVMSSAVDFMESLPEELAKPVQRSQTSESTGSMSAVTRAFGNISLVAGSLGDHYHWLQVIFVLGRQWFARAWTLQEFLVASKSRFIMGNKDISSNAFIKAALGAIQFYMMDPLATQVGLNTTFLAVRKRMEGRATLFKEREKYQNGKRYSAEEYMSVIRARRATELKDKVIAGSALLDDRVSFKVDYKATTLEIYISYAKESLWPEVGLFALSLVGGTARSVEGLPTWVPDLGMDLRPEPLRYCGAPTFSITPEGSRNSGYTIEGNSLHLSITIFDVVKDVGESIWSWTKFSEASYNNDSKLFKMRTSGTAQSERFGLMFEILNRLGIFYAPTGERTIDAFWQTLIAGINLRDKADISVWRDRFYQFFAFTLVIIRAWFNEEKKDISNKFIPKASKNKWMVPLIADWPNLEQRVSSFLDFHDQHLDEGDDSNITIRKEISRIAKRLLGTETIDDVGTWQSTMTDLLSAVRGQEFYGPITVFGQHFEVAYEGKRIFTTERGYMGTGAEDTRPGDCVVLVDGADVPFILRPITDRKGAYTLVSEAYIHGVMEKGGELLAEAKFEPIIIV
ncbi:hypothetical protein DM02DRAFT_560828 [Periconia macrospinosa]|uniref:Heterokaryon incompatibility domain-containing protein n=1 Tax=Periconia macrospinosa TaxID=97972 RepID=A0A2V1DUG9_9PLEO|nr:hypothetical protein DM02DRAFT_560828 [Periconia macrospinosa]